MDTQRKVQYIFSACVFVCLFTLNAAFLSATYFHRHVQHNAALRWAIISVLCFAAFCMLPVTLLFWSLARKSISTSHTLRTVLYQHVALLAFSWLGKRSFNRLVKICCTPENLKQAQQKYLNACVKFQKQSDYGMQHHLENVKTLEDLKELHPLTNYGFYSGYINNLYDGNRKTFGPAKQLPTIFGLTSGTSGKPNIIPFYRRQSSVFLFDGVVTMWHCLSRALPNMNKKMYKGVKFWYSPCWRTSPDGVRVGPASSSPQTQKSMLALYTTPPDAFKILNEPLLTYLHLLSALRDRQLLLMEANFASLVYNAFSLMLSKWKQLVNDVRNGGITPPDADAAAEYADLLATIGKSWPADPDRAEELDIAFSRGLQNLARRIWPELEVVICAVTGSFAHYADLIRPYLGVPLFSPIYAATEGLIGFNPFVPVSLVDGDKNFVHLNGLDKAVHDRFLFGDGPDAFPVYYILHPSAMVYELIPVSAATPSVMPNDRSPLLSARRASTASRDSSSNLQKNPACRPLLLHEQDKIEVNGVYELAVTNASGLFRYCIGDVVAVRGFFGCAPLVEFLYRQGQRLDCRGEKLSEHLFYNCLVESVSAWLQDIGRDNVMKLVDYCATDLPMVYQTAASPDSNASPVPVPSPANGYTVFLEFGFAFALLSERLSATGGNNTTLKVADLQLDAGEISELDEALDSKLQAHSYVYYSFRVKDAIGSVKCVVVMPGTFKRLRSLMLSSPQLAVPQLPAANGGGGGDSVSNFNNNNSNDENDAPPLTSGPNQIKIPRVMRKPEALRLLQQSRWLPQGKL